MEYISAQFTAAGLQARGTSGYFQAFDIYDGKQVNPSSSLSINGNMLELNKEYFLFPFSPNTTVEGEPVIAVPESGLPWFFDLTDVLEENSSNPHFDLNDYIYTNAKKVADRGASAVFLYNFSATDDNLKFQPKDRSATLSIPVVYLNAAVARKFFSDPSAAVSIKLVTDISTRYRTGHNVVGYIDNGAATTVVLGAHFDHLGYGEDGNSMHRGGEAGIHNGADDNASGTAALIELGRMLKTAGPRSNNYLLIAFSGEELGLFGSKYYVENPTIPLGQVNYMINMDMVGRLNDSTNALTIGGVGTSPAWMEALAGVGANSFNYKYDSSGTGPSDHTSFYRKDIPVLFYFTGLHTDYHKPGDDADKINYDGASRIVQHVHTLIKNLDGRGKLAFLKTREVQMAAATPFRVTLGIMPDYTWSGTGVRADGVTADRPAAKAGLQAGDIITQLGDHKITDMQTYMQALGKFKKGDSTRVIYLRGKDTREAEISF